MSTKPTPMRSRARPRPEKVAPPSTVRAAPGMLGCNFVVAREEGEPDDRYRSRCALFDLLLRHAAEG